MATPPASDDDKPTRVMYEHCQKIYQEMVAQATDSNDEGLVYEGFTTQLFSTVGLPVPYYTEVFALLRDMGCVEQLRRGGGNTPSRWRIMGEPDEESFRSFDGKRRVKKGKNAILEQQMRDLRLRVSELESAVAFLVTERERELTLRGGAL